MVEERAAAFAKRSIKTSAKLDKPGAVFYDITWTGYCGSDPPSALRKVFEIVRGGRDRAIERVKHAISNNQAIHGFEVGRVILGSLGLINVAWPNFAVHLARALGSKPSTTIDVGGEGA